MKALKHLFNRPAGRFRIPAPTGMLPVLLAAMLLTGSGLPGNLEKKVHRELARVLGEVSYTLEPVAVAERLNASLPVRLTDANFFRVNQSGQTAAYVFLGEAPSKTAQFDFLVLLDAGGQITHSAVLIYREEYGGEIGSRRWLRQFEGLGGTDRVSVGENIDGISGATISVVSMTRAMDDFLVALGQLQQNGFFHEP